jgi:hypothetical protein
MNNQLITAKQLRDLLAYNPDTGEFRWRIRPSKAVKANDLAGSPDNKGYCTIGIQGRIYKAHRLAWLYEHGKWPDGLIDHINGNKSDNRLCNLREVNNSGNAQNIRRPNRRNKSGFLGVIWFQNKWRANITVNKKTIWLGDYSTPEEAHSAYISAKRAHHNVCTL